MLIFPSLMFYCFSGFIALEFLIVSSSDTCVFFSIY